MGVLVGQNGATVNLAGSTPLLADLLAVLTFVTGGALVGLGIWGSLRAAAGPVQLASTAAPQAA